VQATRSALAPWIAGVAFLLVLGSGCNWKRKDCPGCKLPDPIPVGCPYAASNLGVAYANGTITDPSLLILSGGGSHGAWGAGVIAGWPEAATASPAQVPRPEFTVVTGISTGALQATYAFLGENYDAKLESLFTTPTNSDIYTNKWNFLWSNSLQSREPLRQIIHDQVTETIVDEVAGQANRELYVGTVNLDTSQFCPWNLSTIARNAKFATSPQKRECWIDLYRQVVFAASGAPVIAPPVEIDSSACTAQPPQKMLHVDGGVRLRVFVTKVVDQAIESGITPTAYVIMNGKLATHPHCVADSLLPIAVRTFEIMDHESLFGSLYALMYDRQNLWNLRLSRIPDGYCLKFPGSEFDPPQLKCLFDKGKAWVQQPDPWERKIPDESAMAWPAGCCPSAAQCPGKSCPLSAGCPP
jgi:predicted acylesterase/phospholipase RssA